nr:hypothetical protein Iba_scaffold20062CG0010 [Ipomoea batatas]
MSQAPIAQTLTPSSLSTSPPAPPCHQTTSSSSTAPSSPPVLSPNALIFSTSVVSSPNNLAPSLSSALPVVPAHFIKVTDWKSMQIFQYQLHLEHLKKIQEMEDKHIEFIDEQSMKLDQLQKENASKWSNPPK